jgi:hypothetical protein
MIALSMLMFGHVNMVPALAISEMATAACVLAFAANIFLNLRRS